MDCMHNRFHMATRLSRTGITGITATSTDSTKKGAKHKACNLALKQIVDGVGKHTWNELDACLDGWIFEDYEAARTVQSAAPGSGSSSSPEHDSFNFVGALSEFCQKETAEKVVGPDYKDLDCKFVGHTERMFEVECNLYFVTSDGNRHVSTIGSGSTKKSAKRLAAAEMYRLLKSEGLDLSVKPIHYHKPGEEAAVADTSASGREEDVGTTEWDDCETESQSPAQPDPQSPDLTDFFQLLQDLAVNLNLKLQIDDVSAESTGCFRCLISAASDEASSETTRVACGESSISVEASQQSAAQKLLKILKNE